MCYTNPRLLYFTLLSATFQKIPRAVSRLGLEPRLVGRLGSGAWVNVSFKIFALTAGDVLDGREIV